MTEWGVNELFIILQAFSHDQKIFSAINLSVKSSNTLYALVHSFLYY